MLLPATEKDAAFMLNDPETLDAFRSWLIDQSTIMLPAQPYEVIRFQHNTGIGIVMCNKKQIITYVNAVALSGFNFFRKNKLWTEQDRSLQVPVATFDYKRDYNSRNLRKRVIRRDGLNCIYCDTTLTEETSTLEHIVPFRVIGTNSIENLAIACLDCNQKLGAFSAAKKIRWALAKARTTPEPTQ